MCRGMMGVVWHGGCAVERGGCALGWVYRGHGCAVGWVCDSAGVTPGWSLAFCGHELSTAKLGGTGLGVGQGEGSLLSRVKLV